MTKKKITIGRVDRIDFPLLQLFDIACKVDTGAATSAIHCHRIKLVERDGKDFLKVWFLDPKDVLYNEKAFEFDVFAERMVKPTTGVSERRYVIETEVIIFNKLYPIELTLADRETMKYPILLGKNFLIKKFVVDVAKVNTSHKEKCQFLTEQAKVNHENSNTL